MTVSGRGAWKVKRSDRAHLPCRRRGERRVPFFRSVVVCVGGASAFFPSILAPHAARDVAAGFVSACLPRGVTVLVHSVLSPSQSAMASSSVHFVDVFELRNLDMVDTPDGRKKEKKFDRVSRLVAQSESYDTEVVLDFNNEIYPMYEGDKFELALAHSLNRYGQPETEVFEMQQDESSLIHDYEYVMHGKIFKYAEEKGKAIVYVSFGGLLMALKGEPRTLRPSSFEVGENLYLLIKKIGSV